MIIFCVTYLGLKLKKDVSVSIFSKAATGASKPNQVIKPAPLHFIPVISESFES